MRFPNNQLKEPVERATEAMGLQLQLIFNYTFVAQGWTSFVRATASLQTLILNVDYTATVSKKSH